MKNKELVAKLLELDPELEVLQTDMDDSSSVWEILSVTEDTAGRDEFPDSYNLPEGCKFIRLDS